MNDFELYDERYREAYKAGLPYLHAFEVPEDQITTLLPASPAYVLDVGCGEGFVARWFAQRGYHVLAMDISRSALDKAQEINSHHLIKYIQDDILTAQLAPSTFDFAVDIGCAHLMSNKRRRYQEYTHVFHFLKPGAAFYFVAGTVTQPHLTTHSVFRHYTASGEELEAWLPPIVGGIRQSAQAWCEELCAVGFHVDAFNELPLRMVSPHDVQITARKPEV